MRSNVLVLVFIFLQMNMISLFAQNKQDKVILNVAYEFEYVRDAANKDDPYIADMVLSLGKQSSRYCSEILYNESDAEAARNKEKQKALQNMAPEVTTVVTGRPLLLINNHGAIINEEIIKQRSSQKMILYSVLGIKNYKVETPIPEITWEIQSEKKVIGEYSCQKAVGTYGGRTYEVWFAPQLPFQDGPWKLSGLPGLILEAHDSNNEVRFLFKGISRNTAAGEKITSFLKSQSSIPTNLKAYNRAKAEFEVNPEAVMNAFAPNANLGIINIADPLSNTVKKIEKHNPMEIN